jgi:hypothetical protein
MLLRPTELVDEMVRMPGIPLIDFSRGSVIWLSIISAFAPVYEVLTVIIGGSMAGYSLTPRYVKPIIPNSMRSRFITVARMGLFIDSSDIFIFILARRLKKFYESGSVLDG